MKARSAGLFGADKQDIFTGTVPSRPLGITVDTSTGRVYWIDVGLAGEGKIYRSEYDGADRVELYGGLNSPYRVALDVAEAKSTGQTPTKASGGPTWTAPAPNRKTSSPE